jgi:hypothetical protein
MGVCVCAGGRAGGGFGGGCGCGYSEALSSIHVCPYIRSVPTCMGFSSGRGREAAGRQGRLSETETGGRHRSRASFSTWQEAAAAAAAAVVVAAKDGTRFEARE